MKTCWIIAEPNGAGKTTFALDFLPSVGCQHFINADAIAAGLNPINPEAAVEFTILVIFGCGAGF